MKKLCVIGDPIGHSKSPLIQNAMLRAAGLDFVYHAQTVTGTDTARWLEQAKQEGYGGFNATMPHKENLVPLMDELSADAALFRSVNTVCIREGKAYGFNTDGDGFLQALREADMDPAGKQVLVLGAGGAAKAVTAKLVQAGAAQVCVANRTTDRAEALCRTIGSARLSAHDFSRETLCSLAEGSDLVVNCTSLGMTGTPGRFEDLSFLEKLRPGSGVFDLIYSPARTDLLRKAEALGLRVSNGLGMLVWQAVFALELFTQSKPDRAALAAIARKTLEEHL